MSGQATNIGETGRPLPDLPLCGFTPRPNDPTIALCNRPAVAHITPLHRGKAASWTVYACTRHVDLILPRAWDAHPVSLACSHPRSVWVKGTAFRVSVCAMPRETA